MNHGGKLAKVMTMNFNGTEVQEKSDYKKNQTADAKRLQEIQEVAEKLNAVVNRKFVRSLDLEAALGVRGTANFVKLLELCLNQDKKTISDGNQ